MVSFTTITTSSLLLLSSLASASGPNSNPTCFSIKTNKGYIKDIGGPLGFTQTRATASVFSINAASQLSQGNNANSFVYFNPKSDGNDVPGHYSGNLLALQCGNGYGAVTVVAGLKKKGSVTFVDGVLSKSPLMVWWCKDAKGTEYLSLGAYNIQSGCTSLGGTFDVVKATGC